MSDQAPPQNIEAEKAVLGAMLVTQSALRRVRVESGLTPRHFYLDRHRAIFKAIALAAERHGAGSVDELIVVAELGERGWLDGAGGQHYVAELAAEVPAAGNALHYATLVRRAAERRAKLEGGQLIQAGALEVDEEKAATLIRDGLHLAASDFTIDAEPTSREEVMDEFFDWLDDTSEPDVFELPWAVLNQSVLGGYRRKQMSVLAGWPKMGKSFVLDQMFGHFTGQGWKTAIFAPEVSRMERAVRHLTMKTGIASEKLMRKRLTPQDYRRLVDVREGGLPFDYFEAPGWSAERIAERIIYGGYDIVAIDPVTKLPGFEKTEGASQIVGRLTEVATRADCHVVLVCHLNRNRGTAQSGARLRPVASDLRGSGMIEGDAHAILFLHRDQDDKANVLRDGELYIDRSRTGPPRGLAVTQLARTLEFFPKEDADELGEQQALDTGKEAAHDRQAG